MDLFHFPPSPTHSFTVQTRNVSILSYVGGRWNSLLVLLQRAYPVAATTRSRDNVIRASILETFRCVVMVFSG
eukprot:COSAG02_NODE_33667_length_496_cov_1.664987_1_plen_72_part_01